MTFVVEDGEGNGKKLGVDSRFRAKVAALTETESNNATTLGLKFNINTGDISINNAVKLTTLYLKNNDDRDLIIDSLIYNIGSSAGGAGDILIDVIRNPSTGDIITNANPPAVGAEENANLNFGSSTEIDADIYKGAVGETVISGGGDIILTRRPNPSGAIFISPGGGFILKKGSSMAINYTPPTGNTGQTVQFALNVYVKAIT